MAMIRIDPDEMTATASVLRSLAVETAEIGRALPACCSCAMPSETESLVNQLVARADMVLDEVAARLGAEAAALTQRGAQAGSNSLVAAGTASGAGLAGLYPTSATIGGGGLGFEIVGGGAPAPTSGTIGGGGPPLLGSATIGGGWGTPELNRLGQQEHEWLQAGLPPTQGMLNALAIRNWQSATNDALVKTWLTPSRNEVENNMHRPITLTEYGKMFPRPTVPPLRTR